MVRRLLVCGFVAAFVSAAGAAPPEWEERHDLSAADFEKAAKELKEKGFRPMQICGYAVGADKPARFTAVWEKRADGPAWDARHDLTAKQYEEAAAELQKKGLRPVELCGYESNGEVRYAAIWEQEPKGAPAREVRPALTSDEFRKLYAELSNTDFRPVRLSGYAVGKEVRFATIWEKAPKGAEWHTRRDLTADQYQEVFDEQKEKKLRLVQVSSYTVNGEERLAGVWEKPGGTGPGTFSHHTMDATRYEAALADYKQRGFYPVQVTTCAVKGQTKYAAVWVGGTPAVERPVPRPK